MLAFTEKNISGRRVASKKTLAAALILSALCAVFLAAAEDKDKEKTAPPAIGNPGIAAPANPAPAPAPVDEAAARKAFAADYEAGTAAVAEKNWPLARTKFTSALKALGEVFDPKKTSAQVLLAKAERLLLKDDVLFTANEMLRLKQWIEAEEAFRKVVDLHGETETLRKDILACRAGLSAENADLRTADELLKAHKWKEATDILNKASDTLGGIRMIRDGLVQAKNGAESDDLLKKAAEFLKNKQWDDAFSTYNRIMQLTGDSDEIQKGIAAARAGFAEDHKPAPEKPKAP